MSTRRIAFFTIGESPRIDIVPAMTAMLGSHVRVDEFGALDALDAAARAALAPHEGGGHHRFVTRLRDGGSIELDKDATEARLADVMRQADGAGYDLLVPLCTGTALPRLRTLVVEPQQVVDQMMAALARHATRVGVLVPLPAQTGTLPLAHPMPCEVHIDHASPYERDAARAEAAFERAGKALGGCDFIVMHCMGYTEPMRAAVARASGRPTLLSNGFVAQALAQLLA